MAGNVAGRHSFSIRRKFWKPKGIPFPETRNYVQRVLENLEVYRNRLSNSDQRLGILSDLYRPNAVSLAAAKPLTATAAPAAVSAAAATVVAPPPATAQ